MGKQFQQLEPSSAIQSFSKKYNMANQIFSDFLQIHSSPLLLTQKLQIIIPSTTLCSCIIIHFSRFYNFKSYGEFYNSVCRRAILRSNNIRRVEDVNFSKVYTSMRGQGSCMAIKRFLYNQRLELFVRHPVSIFLLRYFEYLNVN